jgi:heat shock protein HslJ
MPDPLDIRPEGAFDVLAFDAWSEGLVEPRPDTTLTIELLEAGRLEGQTGCGTYFGAYALDGDDLALGVVSKGPDPCGLKRTEEAVAFSIALDAVTSWLPTISGLELLDAGGQVRVVLERSELAGLAGDWVIKRVVRPGGGLKAPPESSSVILDLDADGTLEGSTGCRLIEGFYSTEADRVAIGPLGTVGLPCDGELRRHERRLLDAFDRTILWQRSGSELRLTDGNGTVLMELTEGVADPPAPEE